MVKTILFYVALINVVAFVAYGVDKLPAIRGKWRVLVTVLLAVMLGACDNGSAGDSAVVPKEPVDRVPVAAKTELRLELAEDLLSYFRVFLKYTDADGDVYTENIMDNIIERSFYLQDLDLPMGYKLYVKGKRGVDLNGVEKIDCSVSACYNVALLNSGGEVVATASSELETGGELSTDEYESLSAKDCLVTAAFAIVDNDIKEAVIEWD